MNLLKRIRRKIHEVLRYPPLGSGARDRRLLGLLGLVRNRVPGSRLAVVLANRGKRSITPRLVGARGQRVSVHFDRPGQVDVFDELFLERIYDLDRVAFPPELVADCGAFCGYFSALAAGYFPSARLHCFEANPANLPMLRVQLDLLDPTVELHPVAVHVRDGVVDFSGDGMGGSIRGAGASEGSLSVPCIDFPRWLRDQAPRSLVWKLDVEGAELELLPATLGVLPRMTVCYLETHFADSTCETLLAPYRAAGFDVREIRRRPAGSGTFSYIEWQLTRND